MPKGQHTNPEKTHQQSKYHPPATSDVDAAVLVTPAGPQYEPRFEDVFATLAPRQQVWLAIRSTMDTDSDANSDLDVTPQMSSRWKSEPAFRFCYERMAKPNPTRERDLVTAIERSNAVRAAVEKQRLIMKPWGDCSPGEMRAKTTLIEDTLERVNPKRARIEHHSTQSLKELVTQTGDKQHQELEPEQVTESESEDDSDKDSDNDS